MNAMAKAGLQPGDVVDIHLPNSPRFTIGFHAAAAAGALCTLSNPLYTAVELSHQLKDSGAKFVLTLDALLPVVKEAAELAGGVKDIWVLGRANDPTSAALGDAAGSKFVQVHPDLRGDDMAKRPVALPYSSGTSGKPKGVVLSHTNVAANIAQISEHPLANLDMPPGESVLSLLPSFHIYGFTVCVCSALRQQARVVSMPKFDPEQFLKVMAGEGIAWAPLVPPILLFMAKHPAAAAVKLPKLRTIFSGAAPLDSELVKAVEARFGHTKVYQGYGMSELSPVSHFQSPKMKPGIVVPGSVGWLAPNTEARLVDPTTGTDAAPGEQGELWVRGPQVMLEYLHNPTATAETLVADGWLRTGDLASVDSKHRWFIHERLKELIKVKGFQVAPAELEATLLDNPQVADCAVVGKKHDARGEIPVAFIVKGDPGLSEEAVHEWMSARLAEYKQLGEIRFIEAIPKSAAGKLLRRELRALL